MFQTSDLQRRSINSDPFGRYYTSNWISQLLVDSIPYKSPRVILELGAGDGALSRPAMKKWNSSLFITVDLNSANIDYPRSIQNRDNHTHHTHDVLDHQLNQAIGIGLASADIALCNPPYIRPRWRDEFKRILSEAGLSNSLISRYDAGADLLFVAQNLRLLKTKGKLGLILPDGLITGEKFTLVRQVLLNEHLIEEVIQLPRNAFTNTEAQTYIVVVSKNCGPTTEIKLSCFSSINSEKKSLLINREKGYTRLDYKYHATLLNQSRIKAIKIRDICNTIERGNISSSQISSLDFPTFHLTDFSANSNLDILIPKNIQLRRKHIKTLPNNIKVAHQGDILIARIGRNLHEKVGKIKEGSCVISDCIFKLNFDYKYQINVLNYLKSLKGQKQLEAITHGVGASYLTKQDLLNINIPKEFL